ncbi:hypothetical protein WEI85_02825 [Actinomycetes bacterium KLBMP 9797]
MNLTEQLQAASADPPPTAIDLNQLMAREDRRRARVRWLAAGCAAAIALAGTTVAVHLAAPAVDERAGYAWSTDRLPDLDRLPGVAEVWPDAVHRLPATLPDGAKYTVYAVLGDERYLVGRVENPPLAAQGPLVFDVRTGTATSLAPTGDASGGVLMAKVVGDQVVWMREDGARELWVARLDGTGARRLAELPDRTWPRFTTTADAVLLAQDIASDPPTEPLSRIWRVPLSGGAAVPLPDSTGWALAHDGSWLTTQVSVSGITPHEHGELWNVATGQKLRWIADARVGLLNCGPRWCSGFQAENRVVFQRLDGTGYVELPYTGHLDAAQGGRLAVGSLIDGEEVADIVWDRETGRAGVVSRGKAHLTAESLPKSAEHRSTDFDPPIQTWRGPDQRLMVLDLTAIS